MKSTLGIGVLMLVPSLSWGCACGCGVFDVQTRSLFPTGEGGVTFFEYNYMDQSRNWSGNVRAPDANNKDKEIRTEYYTLGAQYMFNREWGLLAQVPVEHRYFMTTDDSGALHRFTHTALGDLRIKGIYAGLSPDMSTGLTLGLKLPTGDYTYPNFDCDTEIGTGSTDVLLEAYSMGRVPFVESWDWFANVQYDRPFLVRDKYHPGAEVNAVAGVYYNGWRIGNCKLAPVVQAVGSTHWRDYGTGADPDNTGYNRVLVAPGMEFDIGKIALYADVAFPIYQYVNGNQLVAPELFTVRMSYSF
ncbi:MAG: transporter [Kiritimatiellaeota bacterium]|nr:transporter [Kiritimatiellota bacterium]